MECGRFNIERPVFVTPPAILAHFEPETFVLPRLSAKSKLQIFCFEREREKKKGPKGVVKKVVKKVTKVKVKVESSPMKLYYNLDFKKSIRNFESLTSCKKMGGHPEALKNGQFHTRHPSVST